MAEPTIIEIHNYAGGGGGGPLEEIPMGLEVSRFTAETDNTDWMWGPSFASGESPPKVTFKLGKVYTIYETDPDD